jgi:hypothetical protein
MRSSTGPGSGRAGRSVLFLAALAGLATAGAAAQAPRQTAWFGLVLPPAPGREPAVIVGDRGTRPAIVPAGEEAYAELGGAAIRADLETIVGFSRESRATHEIGSGQLWGRVAGFPSSTRTVNWAVEQFRKAGIADVKVQSFAQDARASFWLPLAWEVRLLGDPAFGAGTADLVLQSAMPLTPSEIPGGTLTAPLVYVGGASPAVVRHVDVKGKIAVQLVVPQGHMVFERGPAVGRAQDLMKRGAVAVLNIVRLPGNELARDFANCGGPCFNIGGRDGAFLENVFDKAAAAGVHDRLEARLTLRTGTRTNLKAENGVAVVRGSRSDEAIIVNAHADAWFDGAGDNADGLAVMVALARHFAKPQHAPQRTLVFVASAGHHSPGLNGPRNVIALNPEIAQKTVLMLNIEHVAQRNFSPARSVADDGVREAVADSGEAPIVAGVSNGAPFLDALFQQGVARYGVNFVSEPSTMESGETGGYQALKVARITVMQAPPLYHTTGEVAEVISTPGLERIARFFAFFVKEVDKAQARQINP